MKMIKYEKIHHQKIAQKIALWISRICTICCIVSFFLENFRQYRLYWSDEIDFEYIGGHYDCFLWLIPAMLWYISYKFITPYYYRQMYDISDRDIYYYENEPFMLDE